MVHGNIPAAERERLSVFQCDICGNKFQYGKLKDHIRQCSYESYESWCLYESDYKTHMATKHLKKSPVTS